MSSGLWNPAIYLSFEDHRLRPAVELVGRVRAAEVSSIVDLGCGTGNVAEPLLSRWPGASYIGVDSSDEMLDQARRSRPDLHWARGDAATWSPSQPVDLLYSNAALHWLDHHEVLFPRLVGLVRQGGTLAVQMPNNFHQPTHTSILKAVEAQDWSVDLAGLLRPTPVHDAGWYYDLLTPLCSQLDLWSTTYHQQLTGPDPVVTWTSGSVLRPFLTALEEPERQDFLAHYRQSVSGHYPTRDDGTTILAFTRLFIVGVRTSVDSAS